MTRNEKIQKCQKFFAELAELLKDSYEQMSSCNDDISSYLVPFGTKVEVTYHSKPERSFRISDHWNWYANTKKCSDPFYVQCYSVDMPWARQRQNIGKPSLPRNGVQVAVIINGKYHCVYGEKFDRRTKKWYWIDSSPAEIAASYI